MEWPGRDYTSPPKGYLYLVFEEEGDVKDLLAKCNQDFTTRDSYYYKISSRRMRAKDKVCTCSFVHFKPRKEKFEVILPENGAQ